MTARQVSTRSRRAFLPADRAVLSILNAFLPAISTLRGRGRVRSCCAGDITIFWRRMSTTSRSTLISAMSMRRSRGSETRSSGGGSPVLLTPWQMHGIPTGTGSQPCTRRSAASEIICGDRNGHGTADLRATVVIGVAIGVTLFASALLSVSWATGQ